MTLTQGHPYLRNNDVFICFIIFCIYTVRYKEVNQNIPDSPNTGCKDGKVGLEPILFEGQMSSDFLQDLVCNGKSVCSKGCVCFEQNLSCTKLCPCQALDLCHNVITHRTDIEDDDA
jgi:hypothetical protein